MSLNFEEKVEVVGGRRRRRDRGRWRRGRVGLISGNLSLMGRTASNFFFNSMLNQEPAKLKTGYKFICNLEQANSNERETITRESQRQKGFFAMLTQGLFSNFRKKKPIQSISG